MRIAVSPLVGSMFPLTMSCEVRSSRPQVYDKAVHVGLSSRETVCMEQCSSSWCEPCSALESRGRSPTRRISALRLLKGM